MSASCALASFYDARRRPTAGARETDGRTDEAGGAASSPLPLSRRLRLSSDVIACPTEDFPEVACARPPVRLYTPHARWLLPGASANTDLMSTDRLRRRVSGTCVRRGWE